MVCHFLQVLLSDSHSNIKGTFIYTQTTFSGLLKFTGLQLTFTTHCHMLSSFYYRSLTLLSNQEWKDIHNIKSCQNYSFINYKMPFSSFRFLTTIDFLWYITLRKVWEVAKISKHRQPCMNCNVVSGQTKHISFHLINNKLHTTTSGCFLLPLHWHWFNCDWDRSCFLSERFIGHL